MILFMPNEICNLNFDNNVLDYLAITCVSCSKFFINFQFQFISFLVDFFRFSSRQVNIFYVILLQLTNQFAVYNGCTIYGKVFLKKYAFSVVYLKFRTMYVT